MGGGARSKKYNNMCTSVNCLYWNGIFCVTHTHIRFNFLFFKRLCLVLRVAIPGLCSKSLLLLVLLLLVRSTGNVRVPSSSYFCPFFDNYMMIFRSVPSIKIIPSLPPSCRRVQLLPSRNSSKSFLFSPNWEKLDQFQRHHVEDGDYCGLPLYSKWMWSYFIFGVLWTVSVAT